MWPFERLVAWRHLRTGGGQVALTMAAVAIAVVLIIFMAGLINGLQVALLEDILGSGPLVTVTPPDRLPTPLWRVLPHPGPVVGKVEAITQQRTTIEQWAPLEQTIDRLPHVTAVSATAEGAGFVARGARSVNASIVGVQPDRQARVTNIGRRMVKGRFADLDSDGAVIGIKMAQDLHVTVGDRVIVTSSEEQTGTFYLRGIFDVGLPDPNERLIYLTLHSAQGLLALGNDVSAINISVDDPFIAEQVAQSIRPLTKLDVKSWVTENRAFYNGLRGQKRTSNAIVAISVLAAVFAVAGVMLVFVMQKSREIGILKVMGATRAQILRLFLLEGLGLGLGGGLVGGALGTGLAILVQHLPAPGGGTFGGRPATIVPMRWEPIMLISAVLIAALVGVAAGALPARRAASVDPVEVIRNG